MRDGYLYVSLRVSYVFYLRDSRVLIYSAGISTEVPGFRNVRVILRGFEIMIITRQRCVSGTPWYTSNLNGAMHSTILLVD